MQILFDNSKCDTRSCIKVFFTLHFISFSEEHTLKWKKTLILDLDCTLRYAKCFLEVTVRFIWSPATGETHRHLEETFGMT